MVGLLSNQPGAPAPGAAAGGLAGGPGGLPEVPGTVPGAPFPVREQAAAPAPNVSADEQTQYDEFVDKGLLVIFDEAALPQILKSLEGNGKPIDGLANTTVGVVTRLEDSAETQGIEISPDVVFNGGIELLESLADLAEKAGIHEYTPEEIEGATFQAMDLYRSKRDIGISQQDLGMNQDFAEIQQLANTGGLEDLAPGITERFTGAPPGARS